jgi:hypothetical protein
VTQRRLGIAIALVVLMALLQGCGGGGGGGDDDEGGPAPTEVKAASSGADVEPAALPQGYAEVTVANGGTIRGVASFKGTAPAQKVIQVTKDNEKLGFDTIPDESMIVSAGGGIQNVVVFIQGIMEGKPLSRSLPAITNKGARFRPHVQNFYQREFLIRSEDPVLHNTHPYLGRKEEGGRSQYNVAISPPEPGEVKEIRRPLKAAGMYQIRCDAHDWMRGWIWVLDHPYGSVSGEDGAYVIDEIPPGIYKLTAWHETLGEQEAEVIVTAGGTAEVDFGFGL